MNQYDWKLISILYSTGSISQASDFLFTTQPTLSKRLRQIEEEFGIQIAIRTSRGITFTPEGKYLAEESNKFLLHYQTIQDNLLQMSSGQHGIVRLGMTNTFARFTMAPFINNYQNIYSHVTFDISTGNSSNVIDLCKNGQIHVGFIRGDPPIQFEKYLIKTDQAILAFKEPIQLEDLPSIPQICYITDPFAKRLLSQWWYDHFNVAPLLGIRANHGDTCREMVMNGLGYGIFLSPEFLKNTNTLFQMPLYYNDGSPLVRNSWMIWCKESEKIPLIYNFIQHVKDHSLNLAT